MGVVIHGLLEGVEDVAWACASYVIGGDNDDSSSLVTGLHINLLAPASMWFTSLKKLLICRYVCSGADLPLEVVDCFLIALCCALESILEGLPPCTVGIVAPMMAKFDLVGSRRFKELRGIDGVL